MHNIQCFSHSFSLYRISQKRLVFANSGGEKASEEPLLTPDGVDKTIEVLKKSEIALDTNAEEKIKQAYDKDPAKINKLLQSMTRIVDLKNRIKKQYPQFISGERQERVLDQHRRLLMSFFKNGEWSDGKKYIFDPLSVQIDVDYSEAHLHRIEKTYRLLKDIAPITPDKPRLIPGTNLPLMTQYELDQLLKNIDYDKMSNWLVYNNKRNALIADMMSNIPMAIVERSAGKKSNWTVSEYLSIFGRKVDRFDLDEPQAAYESLLEIKHKIYEKAEKKDRENADKELEKSLKELPPTGGPGSATYGGRPSGGAIGSPSVYNGGSGE